MSLCRGTEFQVSGFLNTVPAPELIAFRRILRVGIDHDITAASTSQEQHMFHFVKFQILMMFHPDRVSVLADGVANFAEKEGARYRKFM
jgi:hypothetical protein